MSHEGTRIKNGDTVLPALKRPLPIPTKYNRTTAPGKSGQVSEQRGTNGRPSDASRNEPFPRVHSNEESERASNFSANDNNGDNSPDNLARIEVNGRIDRMSDALLQDVNRSHDDDRGLKLQNLNRSDDKRSAGGLRGSFTTSTRVGEMIVNAAPHQRESVDSLPMR